MGIRDLFKAAKAPAKSYAMEGELYLSKTGWLMVRVPHSLVRGVFSTINEQGIELPTNPSGKLEAHISVMRPEELEQIGGPERITERGKAFSYTLGPLRTIAKPADTSLSRVWYVEVKSPDIQALRRSYGLSSNGKFDLHITAAVRRKNVLTDNATTKSPKKSNPFLDLTETAAGEADFSESFPVKKAVTVKSALDSAMRKILFSVKDKNDKPTPVVVVKRHFSVSLITPKPLNDDKDDADDSAEKENEQATDSK